MTEPEWTRRDLMATSLAAGGALTVGAAGLALYLATSALLNVFDIPAPAKPEA